MVFELCQDYGAVAVLWDRGFAGQDHRQRMWLSRCFGEAKGRRLQHCCMEILCSLMLSSPQAVPPEAGLGMANSVMAHHPALLTTCASCLPLGDCRLMGRPTDRGLPAEEQ